MVCVRNPSWPAMRNQQQGLFFPLSGDEKATTRWHQSDFWLGYYHQLTLKNPQINLEIFRYGRDLNPRPSDPELLTITPWDRLLASWNSYSKQKETTALELGGRCQFASPMIDQARDCHVPGLVQHVTQLLQFLGKMLSRFEYLHLCMS